MESISPELLNEIVLLSRFDLSSTQLGIKVHHDAAGEQVAAALSLFDKGMISQKDGGYLTSLGRDAAEHAQRLLSMLSGQ